MGNILVGPAGPDGSAVTVRLQGEVDSAAGADLRSVLISVIMHRKPARILIDLREATAVDACVIGTLRAAYDLARDADLSFAIDGGGSLSVTEFCDMELPQTA